MNEPGHKPAMIRECTRRLPAPRRESGVVLFIALIVLVAMTLAGLAMFRSVGTGVIIAGNLTFKQSATVSADLGIEAGRAWLIGQTAGALQVDTPPSYYSGWQVAAPTLFDPKSYPWDDNTKSTLVGVDGAGNEVRYVVHRMCETANASVNAPGQNCITVMGAGTGSTKEHGFYGNVPLSGTFQAYYRITARAMGPKNTFSYVQSIVY
jgi:type IV pilus assembly protein PilX